MGKYSNTAIVFGSLKEALLYYDFVIPLRNPSMLCVGVRCENDAIQVYDRIFDNNDGSKLEHVSLPLTCLPEQFRGNVETVLPIATQLGKTILIWQDRQSRGGQSQKEAEEMLDSLIGRLFKYLSRNGVDGGLIDCSTVSETQTGREGGVPALSMGSLKLVDISRAPAEKVLEFRRDREAFNKMRRFRLFVYDNYTGKDKAYIQDDVLQRLDDYHSVVKSWGFDTKLKAISFVLNSKLTPACLGASFLTALLGSPIEQIAAFSTSIGIEVGNLAIELKNQKHEFRKICRENPISYIADAREKLEIRPGGAG